LPILLFFQSLFLWFSLSHTPNVAVAYRTVAPWDGALLFLYAVGLVSPADAGSPSPRRPSSSKFLGPHASSVYSDDENSSPSTS